MSDLHRRQLLTLGGAAVASLTLPAIPAGASIAAQVAKPPRVAWAVGTPGESDWQKIMARSVEQARRIWAADQGFEECCCGTADEEEFGCEECCARDGAEAKRMLAWDAHKGEWPTDAMWLDAGFDTNCGRCGDPASKADGSRIIDGRAVCPFCLIADEQSDAPASELDIAGAA